MLGKTGVMGNVYTKCGCRAYKVLANNYLGLTFFGGLYRAIGLYVTWNGALLFNVDLYGTGDNFFNGNQGYAHLGCIFTTRGLFNMFLGFILGFV